MIQPHELACQEHLDQPTDGAWRQWRHSWILFQQGVPASIDPAIRDDHTRRLVGRLVGVRANTYRVLAEEIEREEHERAAERARATARAKSHKRVTAARSSAARMPRDSDGRFLPKT